MKIEKIEVWQVDCFRFHSEEEALEYIEREKESLNRVNDNLAAIRAVEHLEVIPVQLERHEKFSEDFNEFTFLFKSRDGDWWRECCRDEGISYVSQSAKIKVLTPGEFMKGFSSCRYEIVSSTQFGKFVKEAARMNTLAGDILSTEEFASVLSRVEIQPF